MRTKNGIRPYLNSKVDKREEQIQKQNNIYYKFKTTKEKVSLIFTIFSFSTTKPERDEQTNNIEFNPYLYVYTHTYIHTRDSLIIRNPISWSRATINGGEGN